MAFVRASARLRSVVSRHIRGLSTSYDMRTRITSQVLDPAPVQDSVDHILRRYTSVNRAVRDYPQIKPFLPDDIIARLEQFPASLRDAKAQRAVLSNQPPVHQCHLDALSRGIAALVAVRITGTPKKGPTS